MAGEDPSAGSGLGARLVRDVPAQRSLLRPPRSDRAARGGWRLERRLEHCPHPVAVRERGAERSLRGGARAHGVPLARLIALHISPATQPSLGFLVGGFVLIVIGLAALTVRRHPNPPLQSGTATRRSLLWALVYGLCAACLMHVIDPALAGEHRLPAWHAPAQAVDALPGHRAGSERGNAELAIEADERLIRRRIAKLIRKPKP